MSERLADWTKGEQAITYQTCSACGHVQYFHRAFCAACGAADPREARASGKGRVYATSLVCRAATPETRLNRNVLNVLNVLRNRANLFVLGFCECRKLVSFARHCVVDHDLRIFQLTHPRCYFAPV